MKNLTSVLKGLKKEGFIELITEEEVSLELAEDGKDTKVLLADDNQFRIFLEKNKYILETSYSNQKINTKWIQKAKRIMTLGITS